MRCPLTPEGRLDYNQLDWCYGCGVEDCPYWEKGKDYPLILYNVIM